jgi:cell division septation protein DedD
MDIETSTQICPLCRRPAASEAAALTRLCRDCRVMLDPILPRAGLVQPDYAISLAGTGASQTASSAALLTLDADFDDVSFAPVAGLSQDFALLDEAAADHFDARPAGASTAETAQPALVHQIHPLAPEVFIVHDSDEDDEISEAARSVLPELVNAPPAPSERTGNHAEIETTGVATFSDLRATAAMPALESRAAQTSAPADETESAEATALAAPSADPWEDPLPAWEYSQNEWPLLVNDQKPSTASKLKWPLITLLIVAAAATAVYFWFIKPRREAPSAQATQGASLQQPLTVPAAPPRPADAPPATANPTPTADNKETPPLASVNQATDNQGKYALQAMATPSEAEANSFVERLKSAAIPAYVVRADLGSHGIWRRVRIGRFATSEEAQRFATEARRRARAIGVTLKDLQVTGYDKP